MIATKMSETFTREQHEGIISDLKKRYKREALRADIPARPSTQHIWLYERERSTNAHVSI